jgi:hypothetical protein
MIGDEPEIEPPEGWVATECRFSGSFKLIAAFENEETGQEIRIRPFKTYDLGGFPDCHRIISAHPEDGVEEIAVGMEVEHVEEAKEAAIQAMKEDTTG